MRTTVKPLKNREPGSGMAVVDGTALSELGLSGGDFVRIEGREGPPSRSTRPSDDQRTIESSPDS